MYGDCPVSTALAGRANSVGAGQDQQELFKSDLRKRSVIEGRIGTSKRKYGLDRIMTKLVASSRAVMGMASFVMNAEKILRLLRILFALLVSVYVVMMCLLRGGAH